MEATGSARPRAGHVAHIVHHNWWLVALAVALGVALGGFLLSTGDRTYVSTTTVLVTPAGAATGAGAGAEVNLDTEAQLVRSTQTATDAARRLGTTESPHRLVAGLRVEPIGRTSVLRIRFAAGTPESAQAGSRAFAAAYLANRARAARADLDAQLAVLTAMLADTSRRLREVNDRIGALADDAPELEDLRSSQSTLASQIAVLTGRVDTLATARITPGAIVNDADLPSAPVRPDRGILLGGGGAVGLLLGLAAALARDRLGSRVRDAYDVVRWSGVAVLADLRASGAIRPDGPGSGGGSGRAYNRLRNEILACLRPEDLVILVTGASSGAGSTMVAANLAAALARAGSEVTLVGASGPDLGAAAIPLSEILDVADVPGLTDVLAHRASLAHALQRAPRTPRLRVITPGGTASAAGLLQTHGVRTVLGALRYHARYVVVEAPSAASGADAQSLARLADVVILVVELRAARRSEVVDAIEQVRRVGTRLLGAVVLPPVRGRVGGGTPGSNGPAPVDRSPAHGGAVPPDSGAAGDGSITDVSTVVLDRFPPGGSARVRADGTARPDQRK